MKFRRKRAGSGLQESAKRNGYEVGAARGTPIRHPRPGPRHVA